MRINIYTNTQKSQFRQVKDGVWQILGIPITVDDAVMNGIHYDKADNAEGLPSYLDKVVTFRHPLDENGNGSSAASGKALMNYFSGGAIINTYNHNGINYADAEFKESLMLAQDGGEYYVNRFKEQLPIGISTGLFFDGNTESGVNAKGEEYHAEARNQVGDHVAMLPDDEPPAGGAATFIRFNGENNEQEITINIDEVIDSLNNVDEIIAEIATNEAEKGLLTKFLERCKGIFAHNKNSCDNAKHEDNFILNKEVDAMREDVIKELKAKGIKFEADATDAELRALLKGAEKKETKNAINAAIAEAVAQLTEQITALKTELACNADKELDKLAKQAAPLMGLDEVEAKALGANALHKVLAKNGVVVGAPVTTNSQSPVNTDAELIVSKPWESK